MPSYALDTATHLEPLGDGRFRCRADQAYWNFTSAFGGWALALALEAVRLAGGAEGDLVSINAIFPDALKAKDLTLTAACLRQKAKTAFWRVEYRLADVADSPLLFSADLVLSKRRASEVAFQTAAPVVPAFEACPVFDSGMGPKWMAHYEQRTVHGQPMTKQARPNSLIWMAERDGRPWDEKGLAAVSDAFMPRVFFADTTLRFGSTVSYSLHVFAEADDFMQAGSEPLLMEGDADAIASGVYDQRGKIWSTAGRLLAVTNQVAFFR